MDAGTSISEERPPGTCPICADGQTPERHDLREMLFGTRERFGYLRCRGCGAMRIASIPSDLGRHYPPEYYEGGTDESAQLIPGRSPLAAFAGAARDRALLLGRGRRRARLLRRWAPPVSADVRRAAAFTRRAGLHSYDDPIVDVGCGRHPRNLANLQKVGFRRLLGIDPFLEGDGQFDGIPLRRRTLEELSGSFQAITFHHSFEHVPDPEATLVAAARRLRPGGVVLIRTPVMGTWFWHHFGTAWWELDPPRHLWIHTRASLEILARRAGLTLVEIVWDSTYLELIASEQISHDVAWREQGSWYRDASAAFDADTIAQYQSLIAGLNREGRAGRAGFYFRRIDGAQSQPSATIATTRETAA